MPPRDSQTRRSLQLIADSLGMNVSSFYEEIATRPKVCEQEGAIQQLSRDSADLLTSFVTLSDPADRQTCIAYVQKIAAGRRGPRS